jgi:tRNA G37 N-methylase Trm5
MHTCEIGKGFIDFSRIMPFVTKGIIEVRNNDEAKPAEMISSYKRIISIIPKFDRISMQLPKNAEEFLDEAFSVAKKGTTIHFYDFQAEEDFEKTKKKIRLGADKAGLKIKFLDFVKCGQISPKKYRVCQDFKII